jgi:hypothetical protein
MYIFVLFFIVLGLLINGILFYLIFRKRKKYFQIFNDKIKYIRINGKLLLQENSGGRIGCWNFTIGLLSISIYDIGIIISPRLLYPEFCFLKKEITKLETGRQLISKGTIIFHNKEIVNKKVFVYTIIPDNIMKLYNN